jgi:hypothetical protein
MDLMKPDRFEGQAIAARFGASISHLVWFMASLQLVFILVALTVWRVTGQADSAAGIFRLQGSVFLTAFALVEYLLSLICWRLFDRGDLLRTAWLLIAIASGSRVAGLVIANFLIGFKPSGVLTGVTGASASQAAAIRELGLSISSPLTAALLGAGLFVVLRLYRKAGLLRRPTWGDAIPLVIVGLFLASQVWAGIRRLMAVKGTEPVLTGTGWIVAPLIGLLLLEAILLHRAVRSMEGGLIGSCWGAYVSAILLTAIGDIGVWAMGYGYAQPQYSYLNTLVWFMASIAYALGPAHQIEAVMRARGISLSAGRVGSQGL